MSAEIENFKLLLESNNPIDHDIALAMANSDLELQEVAMHIIKLPVYKSVFSKALDFSWFVESEQTQNTTEISLSKLKLEKIPDSVFLLRNLEKLYLSTNRIKSISESLGRLKKLKYLDISENQLISLPKSIGNLKRLIGLHLSYNKLTSIPDSIGEMKSLEYFRIDSNQLGTIPKSISNLSGLKIFDLSFNNISVLDSSIINLLKTLEELNLRNNKLVALPTSFSNLPDDFKENRLLHVKNSGSMFVNLEANPLTWVPKAIEKIITGSSLVTIENNKMLLYTQTEDMGILEGNKINSFSEEEQKKKLFE